MQRDRDAHVNTGVLNCAKGTHRETPTASIHRHGDASVFGLNDADRRGAPVLWDTGFLRVNHDSLKQQPLHWHTTSGSCMAIRIRGLPASFGISKTTAGRMTTAFAGTPSFAASQSRTVGPSTSPHTTLSARAAANHKPVVNPSAVAQGPSTVPSPRSPCAAGGTNRSLGEVLLQVERGGEPRRDPQVRRQVNCCEEVTG